MASFRHPYKVWHPSTHAFDRGAGDTRKVMAANMAAIRNGKLSWKALWEKKR